MPFKILFSSNAKLLMLKDWNLKYTPNQAKFHETIDNISDIMTAPNVNSPQIVKGRAQDVYKLVSRDFSKFFRPTSKHWLFKEPIDGTPTLQKLIITQSIE